VRYRGSRGSVSTKTDGRRSIWVSRLRRGMCGAYREMDRHHYEGFGNSTVEGERCHVNSYRFRFQRLTNLTTFEEGYSQRFHETSRRSCGGKSLKDDARKWVGSGIFHHQMGPPIGSRRSRARQSAQALRGDPRRVRDPCRLVIPARQFS